MQAANHVVVTSSAAPPVSWWCSSCSSVTVFRSRDVFRTNANGKSIDIWLLYGCGVCDRTKNLAVVERVPIRRVEPQLGVAAQTHDLTVARRVARDLGILRRNSARLAGPDAWETTPERIDSRGLNRLTIIDLEFPEPLRVPILSVTAQLLAVSITQLQRLIETGFVHISGPSQTRGIRLWSYAQLTIKPGLWTESGR